MKAMFKMIQRVKHNGKVYKHGLLVEEEKAKIAPYPMFIKKGLMVAVAVDGEDNLAAKEDDLVKREEALKTGEDNLAAKAAELAKREEAIAAQEAELNEKSAELAKREKALKKVSGKQKMVEE